MITNVLKPNATSNSIVGELKAISKDFTEDDHVIIVGGPGNILHRDFNYRIDKDLGSIAKCQFCWCSLAS